MKKYKINEKLSFGLYQSKKNPYICCDILKKDGTKETINVHGYIFGGIGMQKYKKQENEHSIILIDGLPGSGKSTLVEGMTALDSAYNDNFLEMDDIAWSMEKFISKMDSIENKTRTIWGDEFIQGTGRFNQSSVGLKLKIGFVTKRLKKNTYYLVVDELKEFPEKLIKMVDMYIHVKKIGFQRGYFDCWTDKDKIHQLWTEFKENKQTWKSWAVKKIRANCKGKFEDYRGKFLDVEEFDKLKIEETVQSDTNSSSRFTINQIRSYIMKRENPDMSFRKIAEELNLNHSTVGDGYRNLSKVLDGV